MELKGEMFTLREWRHGDEASLQRNADNPNVSACLMDHFPYPYTAADAEWWVKANINQHPLLNFVIDIDDEVAGGAAIELQNDVYRKTAKIGYWLAQPYWGKGIMPQVVDLLVDYGFQNLDLLRIQAAVFSNNLRSMRVLEKAGFILEGVHYNAVFKHGQVLDEHVYAILKK